MKPSGNIWAMSSGLAGLAVKRTGSCFSSARSGSGFLEGSVVSLSGSGAGDKSGSDIGSGAGEGTTQDTEKTIIIRKNMNDTGFFISRLLAQTEHIALILS